MDDLKPKQKGLTAVADDWWPSSLVQFADEKPLSGDYVVVAEISKPWGPGSDKLLYTALVPMDRKDELLSYRGSIGYEADSSGPRPSASQGEFDYKPSFYIQGLEIGCDFEPLVIRWESAGKTVLLPDQGFLMTYGLIPRYCENGETLWDDPANRVFDVVKVEPPSEYCYKLIRESRVLIRREYLQDYATVRNMSLFQTYFVANISDHPDSLSVEVIKKRRSGYLLLPNRKLFLRTIKNNPHVILTQVWGYRHLLDPGDAPISNDNDYGVLEWPGYGIVDGTRGKSLHQIGLNWDYVYVRDEVLGEYEGKPDFEIYPEYGSVDYGGQWSVSHCERLGRDNRPNTVKTWHKYSIFPPPIDDLALLREEENIAIRAKNVVYGMLKLGEVLASIASKLDVLVHSSKEFVKLDRGELDYNGWWKDEDIEPITRHAPMRMEKEVFLNRCTALYKVVGEGLVESLLRKTLHLLGADQDDIKELRSLKLLDRLVQIAITANEAGLNILTQYPTLESRRKETKPNTPLPALFALYDLRIAQAHRRSENQEPYKIFKIDINKMASGWGEALDIVYDRTAEALYDICESLIPIARI